MADGDPLGGDDPEDGDGDPDGVGDGDGTGVDVGDGIGGFPAQDTLTVCAPGMPWSM